MADRFWRCYVRIIDHPVFKHRGCLQLLVWLNSTAKKKDGYMRQVEWDGQLRTLERNQVSVNFRDLARFLGAPLSTVHGWMQKLVGWEICRTETRTRFSVVTIEKFGELNPGPNTNRTQPEHGLNTDRTPAEHLKREREYEKEREYSPDFLTFWMRYPKKVAKPAAWKAWKKITVELAEVLKGLDGWMAEWQQRGETQFIPYPATWLNREGWNDAPQVKLTEERPHRTKTPEELEAFYEEKGIQK